MAVLRTWLISARGWLADAGASQTRTQALTRGSATRGAEDAVWRDAGAARRPRAGVSQVLRPHLALTVTDVERSLPFYEALFGTRPEKVRDGYAKFSVAEPALNFTLNRGERPAGLGAFNHAGIQVASTADVLAAKERLVRAGLAAFDEMDTTCCYARQDKIWVRDPDGTPWEVFATHEDTEKAGAGGLATCCAGAA
jgi:catechol 2,3-dioxygenase-like lactoylglutathione lyase family enzyme